MTRSARRERYEVAHVATGWIARHISSNGNEVARSTNVYTHKRGAVRAVELMSGMSVYWVEGQMWVTRRPGVVEVRVVDEREVRDA